MTYYSCFAQCTGEYKHLDLYGTEKLRHDILNQIECLMEQQDVTFEQLTAKLKSLKWTDHQIESFFNPYTDKDLRKIVDVYYVLGQELIIDMVKYNGLETTNNEATIILERTWPPPK